jgi:hypothetical protein
MNCTLKKVIKIKDINNYIFDVENDNSITEYIVYINWISTIFIESSDNYHAFLEQDIMDCNKYFNKHDDPDAAYWLNLKNKLPEYILALNSFKKVLSKKLEMFF